MAPNDPADSTDEPASTDGATRRGATTQSTTATNESLAITRRGALRTTAGLTGGALGLGAGATVGAADEAPQPGLDEFQQLSVSDDNRIVGEDGETFVMRGVNVPDPKRVHRTRYIRGKTPTQLVDLVTNNDAGWYPRVIRVPAQPQDIGEHRMGHLGPEYEEGELESPDVVADNRRKMQPAQPVAFDEDELEEYFDEYYDPIVERCAERGVYCIVDYHRHWHEQPPGDPHKSDAAAENHLPYDSEYTNYWAYNTYEDDEISFGTEAPGSWMHVDQTWIDEYGYTSWDGRSDLEGTPYAADAWQVNEALLEEVQLFWEHAAERYGDVDHVIFEPYNEPTSPAMWGPVDGCGAIKQKPLWDVFLDDFMGPILDTIRDQGYDGLLLCSVPGWCQSLQGLHWRSFEDAGYEDVAVTWHNYAGHDVSQMHNWFNDTDYQSPEDVEAETGEALENPYLVPPDSIDDPDCWGWEGYEAAGLQGAMEYHPIAVTEFGWIDSTEVHSGIRGTTRATAGPTTNVYGEPFVTAMEADPRVSWVAWCADVRWHPTMFEFPEGPEEGELQDALVNDNFYDAEFEDLPQPCTDLPCEWQLLDNPDSGEYLKGVLEDKRDEDVPGIDGPSTPLVPSGAWTNEVGETTIELGWESESTADGYTVYLDGDERASTAESTYTIEELEPATTYRIGVASTNGEAESRVRETTVTTDEAGGGGPCEDAGAEDGEELANGDVVCDVSGDGWHRDVNGDGSVTNSDVTQFFQSQHVDPWDARADLFDFDGDDSVGQSDVIALFEYVN